MEAGALWERYGRYLCRCPSLGLTLDVSRMRFEEDYVERMGPAMERAFEAMADLESGAVANPDENRRVGHYWLRDPDLGPDDSIRAEIRETIGQVKAFAAEVHHHKMAGAGGGFKNLLLLGIGGSALGPELLADALGGPHGGLEPSFMDNTDPDGFDRILGGLEAELGRTLVVVVSKSGGTVETRNALIETAARYELAGLEFARHAVAVTQPGSRLDEQAQSEGWLGRFAIWDWVGGRTSVTSAVGLLPAALMGFDVDAFLTGAREADGVTRDRTVQANPAALLALMWYHATGGRAARSMVVIPYKDRLVLFGRYLQQLVMESLGKQHDLQGQVVHQGLTVYGNKGSTDQHAYVQQLREGPADFFATFIGVGRDREGSSPQVEPGTTSGDYLHGFLLGTRQALYENGRDSLTLTLDKLTPHRLGALIAVFERAVGLYAGLIGVNAYHQPGVEAGKRAASSVIELQRRLLEKLRSSGSTSQTAAELARAVGTDDIETVFHVLEHLANNPDRGVVRTTAAEPGQSRYSLAGAE
ncbi:MAG: glucose-6-phosphate isomerase [Phycisphaerae bacterium]